MLSYPQIRFSLSLLIRLSSVYKLHTSKFIQNAIFWNVDYQMKKLEIHALSSKLRKWHLSGHSCKHRFPCFIEIAVVDVGTRVCHGVVSQSPR